MYTYDEIREQLGEGEIAMVSLEFWKTLRSHEPLTGSIQDNPEHQVWHQLHSYQMGWLACKEFYKIET